MTFSGRGRRGSVGEGTFCISPHSSYSTFGKRSVGKGCGEMCWREHALRNRGHSSCYRITDSSVHIKMALVFIAKTRINPYFLSANRLPFEFTEDAKGQPALALQVAQRNPSGSQQQRRAAEGSTTKNVTQKMSCERPSTATLLTACPPAPCRLAGCDRVSALRLGLRCPTPNQKKLIIN